ncbi:beta-1,4-xylosyltransferase IRX9-like [Curcuma longa]|uniref:beta-1,4-xylosyltransferase IRX9-like n=1 Tax=Curcuma longa TaxID=136217 RepID=UPI003D9F6DCE
MGSIERTRKRNPLWKKAIGHFSLCFVMGFFTGFAPPSTTAIFSGRATDRSAGWSIGTSIVPAVPSDLVERVVEPKAPANRNIAEIPRSIPADTIGADSGDDPPPPSKGAGERDSLAPSRRLIIVVTTTESNDRFQGAFLRRLTHTLRLVPPPLLWIVVQAYADAPSTGAMLRDTGVMYRHLTFKENFTYPEAEVHHQRNVALSHVEYHRLTGIVHFADASNVYDLQFFDQMREIEVWGTWPVGMVSENRKKVMVDGPICHSSRIEGWILKDLSNDKRLSLSSADVSTKPSKINISSFAFNSSILWDPERWGRPTSLPDTSQDSIKFLHEVILEDESKLKGIPPDCSRIMVWRLCMSRAIPLPFHH